MRKKLIGLALVVVLALSLLLPAVALAADPEVAITVYGDVISITNTQATWAIGHVEAGSAAKYFSVDNLQDDDYSMITNTGNQIVDVAIQGLDIEGGAYDWTLGATAGDKIYSLYANKQATPTVYDVEVKKTGYSDITAAAGLAVDGTNTWSMKFTPPTIFDPDDDGAQKSTTVTLVARLHV